MNSVVEHVGRWNFKNDEIWWNMEHRSEKKTSSRSVVVQNICHFFYHYFFEMIQFDESICHMGGSTTNIPTFHLLLNFPASRLPCYDRNQPGSMGLPQGWCRGIPAGTTPGKVIWTNENDDLWSSEFSFFLLFFLKNLSIQVNLFLL